MYHLSKKSQNIVSEIPDITSDEFEFFRTLIKKEAGITLQDSKRGLLKSRLGRRLRHCKLSTWQEYISLLQMKPSNELPFFVNIMTTNKTDFFREMAHFDYLAHYVMEKKFLRPLTLWSAACSSGQEAYSIAMTIEKIKAKKLEAFDYRILATDIDTNVLAYAQNAIYEKKMVEKEVKYEDIKKFFLKGQGINQNYYLVKPEIRNKIKFRKYNLCDFNQNIPVKFDIIFVRNVLIYFDQKTVDKVIDKLVSNLVDGGLLITGHCESFIEIKWNLVSVGPSIYLKSENINKRSNDNQLKQLPQKPKSRILNDREAKLPLRVLVVDDSPVMQNLMRTIIESLKDFKLFGIASHPLEAEEMMKDDLPDVITLDFYMPNMNGIEYLEKIIPEKKIPVLMISGVDDADGELSLKSLELGAIDFIQKPSSEKMQEFRDLLAEKLLMATKIKKNLIRSYFPKSVSLNLQKFGLKKNWLVAIGSSTGGTVALTNILRRLPEDIPPILVVQHIPAKFSSLLASRLNSVCQAKVKEATDGESIVPGVIYIAPGDKHLSVEMNKENIFVTRVKEGEPVNSHIPSVDILFRSVANVCGKKAIGVILTGMGKDGAKGLLEMRQVGAHTIAQDEESCVVFGMPKEAISLGAACEILHVDDIAQHLCEILSIHKTFHKAVV